MAASRKFIREWVAGQMGWRHNVTVTAVGEDDMGNHTFLTIPRLQDIAEDAERMQDSFIAVNVDGDVPGDNENLYWRRIRAYNRDLDQVLLSRAFDDDYEVQADDPAVIYHVLNPDEWNDAVNEALIKLYFFQRIEIDIDDFVGSETPLTDADDLPQIFDLHSDAIDATWLQTKGMVVDVRYRELTTGREVPIPRWRILENANTLKLQLIDPVWAAENYSIIVEAQRYYPRLNEDDWGTTCPTQLWQAAVEVSAYHKIIKKHGARYKAQFSQDLAIAERNLYQMRAEVLPKLKSREYQLDEEWSGPDIEEFFQTSGWV